MDYRVVILLLAEALFALLLLWRGGALKNARYLCAAVVFTALAFALRGVMLDYETLDYQNFLTKWVDFFRTHGGFRAISQPVGNYNIPYLYFLALISGSGIKDLYLIKLFSIFFDTVLAYAVMQLAGLYRTHPAGKLACFFVVLFWPTVLLNGSLWGQCDSVYASLAVLAVYLALTDRPVLSMLSAAASFAFKLQAVFILPVFAVLWMMKKFKWYHFAIFPAAYVVYVLPAVLLGRPFIDTLTLYLSQTGSIGDGLNYNSPSFFSVFYRFPDPDSTARLFILVAFGYTLLVLGACLALRRRLNNKAVLAAAILLCVGIPFLLPHMHERYFFLADVLTLAAAFACYDLIPAAILTEFASLLGYYAYLRMRFLLPMQYGAAALVITAAIDAAYLLTAVRQGSTNLEKKT